MSSCSESEITCFVVAYMEVGEGREHDYREVGGRMKWEPESRSGSFANLGLSRAMTGPVFIKMGRFESDDFDSQTRSSRIDHRLLNAIAA